MAFRNYFLRRHLPDYDWFLIESIIVTIRNNYFERVLYPAITDKVIKVGVHSCYLFLDDTGLSLTGDRLRINSFCKISILLFCWVDPCKLHFSFLQTT
jgi:hypothetical protein